MIRNLYKKYFLIIFSILTFYIVFIGLFNFIYITNQIEKNYIELSSRSIGQKSGSIQKYTSLIENSFVNISNDTQLKTQLSSKDFNPNLVKLLRSYVLTIPGVSQIRVLTHRDELYSTTANVSSYHLGEGVNRFENETFMTKTLQGWSIEKSILRSTSNSLYYTKTVYNNLNQMSYFIIEIDTAFISDIIHSTNASWSDMMLIYNDHIVDLYNTGESSDTSLDFASKTSKLIHVDSNLKTYIINDKYVHQYDFDQLPLQLVSIVPTSQIKHRSASLMIIIALSSFAMIVFSAYLSRGICNLIWKPLTKIFNRFNTEYHHQ